MTKKIIAIWAQAEGMVWLKDKVMPWQLPAELQHFKANDDLDTLILMGRVTLMVCSVAFAKSNQSDYE